GAAGVSSAKEASIGSLSNAAGATISGGNGGAGFSGGVGGAGVLNAGAIATLSNAGAISGGGAGHGSLRIARHSPFPGAVGGAGGAGRWSAGMITGLSNSGTISGGNGGRGALLDGVFGGAGDGALGNWTPPPHAAVGVSLMPLARPGQGRGPDAACCIPIA